MRTRTQMAGINLEENFWNRDRYDDLDATKREPPQGASTHSLPDGSASTMVSDFRFCRPPVSQPGLDLDLGPALCGKRGLGLLTE